MVRKFLLISLLTPLIGFSQSAWTQKEGNVYLHASYNSITNYSDLFSNQQGSEDIPLDREVSDNTFQLYGEYGISDNFSVLLSVPIKFLRTGRALVENPNNSEDNFTALGDFEVGVKYLFYDDLFNITGEVLISPNNASFDNETGLRSGLDAWSFSHLITIGKSWERFYLQGFFGLSLLSNSYNNQTRLGIEGGAKFFDKIWLIGFLDRLNSLNDGSLRYSDFPLSNQVTGLYVNNQEYLAFGVKGILEINPKWDITAAFAGASSGNLVAKAPSFNLGLSYKLAKKVEEEETEINSEETLIDDLENPSTEEGKSTVE